MHDARLLGLDDSWQVDAVDLRLDDRRVEIRLAKFGAGVALSQASPRPTCRNPGQTAGNRRSASGRTRETDELRAGTSSRSTRRDSQARSRSSPTSRATATCRTGRRLGSPSRPNGRRRFTGPTRPTRSSPRAGRGTRSFRRSRSRPRPVAFRPTRARSTPFATTRRRGGPNSMDLRSSSKRLAGEPLRPADSVRPLTHAVHLPVRPWSPRSQGFPREAEAARTPAPRRHGVTSGVAPRRRRSTRSSPRTSRAGSSGGKPPNGPCRAMSRTNSAAISSAAVLCTPALRARAALRTAWFRRPDQSHPLRAAQTQSSHLGRAGSRAEVHAAWSHWRRRD